MDTDAGDWVPVADDLPMLQRGMKSTSVDVIALLDTGSTLKTFYCYRTREWYDQRGHRVKEDVIAWKSV
jgi:hypothetical protein